MNKRELLATHARIIGDIESLDRARVPEGNSVYPTNISIGVVAQAMVAFDKDLVRKFPIEWVQRNVVGRYKGKLQKRFAKLRKKL